LDTKNTPLARFETCCR